MLVLRRGEGRWLTITHRSGDVMRIRVCKIQCGPANVDLAFDDAPRNFEIERDERLRGDRVFATETEATGR